MYAQLCKRLSEEAPNFEPPEQPCTFRLLLLNKCRSEFENRAAAFEAFEKNGDRPSSDEEEKRHISKCKMLGNIKFIGELGKLDILAESILHLCIQTLLVEWQHAPEQQEDLECLAQLVRTCGRALDSRGRLLMDQYFERMERLARKPDLQPRIRFMLRDVIELRRDGWVPRRAAAAAAEGPVPILQLLRADDDRRAPPRRRDRDRDERRRDDRDRDDPLFRRGLRTRRGLDDVLSFSSLSLSAAPLAPLGALNPLNPLNPLAAGGDKFPFAPNGFGGRDRARHQHGYQRAQQGFPKHGQNNNANNKEVAPRFKQSRVLPTAGAMENIQMKPAANSLVYKANNLKPQTTSLPLTAPSGLRPMMGSLGSGNANSNSNNSDKYNQSSNPTPASLLKEPVIAIKPALDKTSKPKKDKGPNKEDILRQVKELMEPLLNNESAKLEAQPRTENGKSEKEDEAEDFSNVIDLYRQLKVPEKFTKDVAFAIFDFILDKSDNEDGSKRCIELAGKLRSESLLGAAAWLDGLRTLTATIAQKESSDSKINSAVASLMASAVDKNICTLVDIASITDNGAHYPLFLLVLQHMHKNMGKEKLTEIYNASKVNLMSMLPAENRSKESLAEALEAKELSFLCPLLRVQAELARQVALEPNPLALYRWIRERLDANARQDPGFIGALVTVVVKHVTQESTLAPGVPIVTLPDKSLVEKEKSLIDKYVVLLRAFVDQNPQLQLIAIYALQVYCYSVNFPKGMLLRWFMALYELEICEEEAFLKWKEDVTDVYPGKGDALFQVNAWLTWLQTLESDSDEADD